MDAGIKIKHVDIEWVKLIKKAKALGLTTEEIRLFLIEFKENSL